MASEAPLHTYQSDIAGPRWVDMETTLLAYAIRHGVRVTIDHVSKGLLRKHVWFTVVGANTDISQWCDDVIARYT